MCVYVCPSRLCIPPSLICAHTVCVRVSMRLVYVYICRLGEKERREERRGVGAQTRVLDSIKTLNVQNHIQVNASS